MTATSAPIRPPLIDAAVVPETPASTTDIRGEKTTFHDVLAKTTTGDLSTKDKLATKVVDARDDQRGSRNNDHDRTEEKSDTDVSTPPSIVMPSPADLQNNTAANIAGTIKSHRASCESAPIEPGRAPRTAESSDVRDNERAAPQSSAEVHLTASLSSPGGARKVPDEAVTRVASTLMATEGPGSIAKSGTLKNAPYITVKSAGVSDPRPKPTTSASDTPDLTQPGLSSPPGPETSGATAALPQTIDLRRNEPESDKTSSKIMTTAATKALAPSVRTDFDTNNSASSRTTSDATAPAASDVLTSPEPVTSVPSITNLSQVDINLPGAHHVNDVLPGVASQLVQVLAPLRQTNTGGHAVTIALHPEGLGSVKATVISTVDQTVVHLSATTSEGASAIRSALPELHNNLATMSDHTTTVLLSDDSSQNAPTFGQQAQQQTNAGMTVKAEHRGTESVNVSETAAATRTSTSNLLDVRI